MKSWWRERREAIPTPNLPDLPSPRKMAQRFRERQSDEHRESLLPSLPRPGHVVAWFREHEGRRRILWATIGVIVLAAGTALAIRPATRGIKAWHARRLATRAATLIDQHQWNDAAAKLQDAYRLRNSEPEVWRMYARLLSRTGQGDMALQWWQKLGQVATLSLEDRRDFTAAALSASELGIAAEQVAHLLDQPGGPAPADLLLAAQFATMRGYVGTAQEFAQRVLDDARASSRDKLGADLVILANTTPDTQNYKNAAERLVELARDQENPAAPDALAVLGHQQRSDPLSVSPGSSLAISAP
jgi:tetratricopeptide (TPR) repeat protein